MSTVNRPSPEAAIRIWLLGGFQVAVGSRLVGETEWRRRKIKSLIKLLALEPGHALHREQALDLLWPDLEPEAAANNLHQTVHLARRVLDPTGVSATRFLRLKTETIALCPEGEVWTDVAAFEQAAAEARRGEDPAAYHAAVERYTGDLLPEDRYEEWVIDRREALRQEYLDLLLGLARLYEDRGAYAAAADPLRRLLAVDGSHEEAHARLMRLYALSGRRQQALRQYQRLQAALRSELGVEPDPSSQRLYQAIREGRFPEPTRPTEAGAPPLATTHPLRTTPVPASRSPAPRADAPHNLPVQLTSFVGRQREKAEVRRLLESARLLTLTGPGGCGKTRLALAVAADMSPSNPDGVWLVELASLGDPTLVPAVVAATLGVQTTLAGRTVEALVAYLAPRRLLLVLDNCEHLLDACATLVDALLRRCPNLRVLATSREALRTPGEVVWLVPSLTLPDPRRLPPLDALVRYEAVQLFLERAAAVDPTFAMTEAEAAAIAEVCYRLDGIPLAIELAAARVQAFSVAQIAARLDDCFHLLQGGSRIGLTRQQTMKATIAWSYDLLTDRERQLFRRLASFAGSFDLEAAERVCAGEGVESCDVLDLLARLIDKSLVVVERGAEAARYRLLEPIRQFAAEQLRMAGEEAATRGRHRAYYLELAETAEDMLHGAPQIHWLDRLEQEHDNLRAALAWSRAEDPDGDLALRFVAALYPFWHLRGHLSEGRQWIEAALRESAARRSVQQEAPDAGLQRARARALYALGALTAYQSDLAAAVPHLEASVDLYRALGDRRHAARAEVLLAGIHFYQGEHARAEAEARECVAALRELEDPWGLAWALFTLGDAVLARDPAEARPLLEESLARYRETGDRWGIALALTSLGRVALYEGNSSAARGLIEEGLALRRATGQQWFIAISLASLGDVARYEGNADEAKTLYQESLDLFQRVGVKLDIAWSLYGLGCAAKMQGDLALAQTLFERSLALEREVGNSTHIPRCLIGLAGVAVDRATKQRGQGPALHAARLLGAAEASLVAQGLVLAPPDSVEHRRVVAAARDALGEEAYRGAHEEGRCAPLDRIVADALGKGLDALARSVDQWA